MCSVLREYSLHTLMCVVHLHCVKCNWTPRGDWIFGRPIWRCWLLGSPQALLLMVHESGWRHDECGQTLSQLISCLQRCRKKLEMREDGSASVCILVVTSSPQTLELLIASCPNKSKYKLKKSTFHNKMSKQTQTLLLSLVHTPAHSLTLHNCLTRLYMLNILQYRMHKTSWQHTTPDNGHFIYYLDMCLSQHVSCLPRSAPRDS